MTGFACDAGLRCWWPMLCRSVFALPRDATECAVVGFAYLWYWSVRVPPLSGKVSTKLPSPCLVQLPDLASEPPTKVEVPGTRWDPARPNQLVCYSTCSPTANLPPTATHSHAKTLGCPSPVARCASTLDCLRAPRTPRIPRAPYPPHEEFRPLHRLQVSPTRHRGTSTTIKTEAGPVAGRRHAGRHMTQGGGSTACSRSSPIRRARS